MKIYLDNNLGVTNVEQEELTQDTIGYNILKVYIPNAVLTPYNTFTCYYGALLQNGRKVGWFAMEARTSTDADYKANYTLYKATLEQCVVSVEGKVYIGCQVLLGNSGNATLIKKNTAVVQFNVRKSVAINNDILVLDTDQTTTDVLESYKNLLENALTTYATKATTYTKTEVNSALALKADKSNTYTKTEVDALLAPKVAHDGNQLKDKDGNNIYPNLDAKTQAKIDNAYGPAYVGKDTSAHILAFTTNRGIWIGSDTGHWYYWNGTQYTDGGVYQTAVNYDELEDKIEEIGSAQSIAYSLNKFDLNTYSEGQINGNNGTITPDTDYWTSDFIEVKNGDTVWYSKISNGVIYYPTSLTIVGLALYDEYKNFIASSKVNWVQAYVINNSNAKYIKVTVNKFNTNTAKVCIGLNAFATQSSQFDDTPSNKYNDVTSFKDFNQVAKYRYSYNRLNPSTISVATQINSLGVISELASYETSDYIMVEPDDVVYYTAINATRTQFWRIADVTIPRLVLFDKDKNAIASQEWAQSYVIPANGKYIRCMFSRNVANTLRVISVNEYPKNTWDFVEFKFEGYSVEPDYARLRKKRRVLWLGSSIPTYGYPEILGNNCHATIINNSRGGSQIIKGIEDYVTAINPCGINNKYHLGNLCQTRAEKQTMIDNWEAICTERGIPYTPIDNVPSILNTSYETALDPYLTGDNAVDIVVINYGYNDSATTHCDTDDVFNMQGAYNWIISRIIGKNPNIGIIIFGNYNWLGDEKEARLNEISNEWGLEYFELRKLLGWTNNKNVVSTLNVNSSGNWETVTERTTTPASIWLGDGIHPIGVASEKIAEVTAPYFKQWLEMYCKE